MKRIISLCVAISLILGVGFVAYADESAPNENILLQTEFEPTFDEDGYSILPVGITADDLVRMIDLGNFEGIDSILYS